MVCQGQSSGVWQWFARDSPVVCGNGLPGTVQWCVAMVCQGQSSGVWQWFARDSPVVCGNGLPGTVQWCVAMVCQGQSTITTQVEVQLIYSELYQIRSI